MLFKLSLKNITNSLRDYAVYFFTLIIAVSVFYVFNAIGGQAAMIGAASRGGRAASILGESISSISIFVSIVLGLLIVYASRFLMKRRNKEFALYMMLGMSKRRISATLLVETFIIGLASLVVGLVAGVGLSQLMSAVVASLFDADMSAYHFTVSGAAIGKTIVNFSFMYLVVMLLNTRAVTRMKLIDLMQSGKRSEQVKMRNPIICSIVFVIACAALGLAYFKAQHDFINGTFAGLGFDILLGCVGTLLFFWSIAGFFLRIALAMKKSYYRGLNCFTVRQIASKVNTVVFSMSVICVMLFFTITMLGSAFALRNGMFANMQSGCPADMELSSVKMDLSTKQEGVSSDDVVEHYKRHGVDALATLSDYVHFHTYTDQNIALYEGEGAGREQVAIPSCMFADYSTNGVLQEVVRLSDYNKLMELYGRETLSLGADQFVVVCDYDSTKGSLNKILAGGASADIFGHTLTSATREVQDGFINMSTAKMNYGFVVVPDEVADEAYASADYLIGNYSDQARADLDATEKMLKEQRDAIDMSKSDYDEDGSFRLLLATKEDLIQQAMTSGALITFICLYLGMVFLVASGAVLALRGLSESVDSAPRYDILRKLGVDKRERNRSLLRQTGFFFAAPLLLACFHAIFGMRCLMPLMEGMGVQHISGSIVWTMAIILVIYGGYFLTTYLGSKRIIEEQRQ